MTTKLDKHVVGDSGTPSDIRSLYLQFLEQYYENEDYEAAEPLVVRLEEHLSSSSDFAYSIRGEEVRSLVAEFRGNLSEAIQSREAEIRKILQLHALSINTPTWDYIAQKYDFADVSDRLDILAILYDKNGELDRAISILNESKQYCQSHGIEFDGGDVLQELIEDRIKSASRKKTSKANSLRRVTKTSSKKRKPKKQAT